MTRPRVVLMNPGPVLVDDRVRQSTLRADICHREVEFSQLMSGIRTRLVKVCEGNASYAAVVLTGSGTTALEATLSSVVPQKGKVLILDNGHYGERLLSIATAHGIATSHLAFGWGNPIDPAHVERALAEDQAITHVAMVHHETSTGMLNRAREIGELITKWKRQFILDAISSIGGEELDVRTDHVDWCVGTANKCIESFPGVSFVCAPQAAFQALDRVLPRTFSLDLRAQYIAQEIDGAPSFTPAVQTLYALDCALDLLISEGVSARARRYRGLADRLRSAMGNQGFLFLLVPEHRSNSVTAFYLPPQITFRELHDRLKADGFVIYACQQHLRDTAFRVANMGQITMEEIDLFVKAVKRVVEEYCEVGQAR